MVSEEVVKVAMMGVCKAYVHTYYHFLAIAALHQNRVEILISNNVVIIQWRKIVGVPLWCAKKGDFAMQQKKLQKNYYLTLC